MPRLTTRTRLVLTLAAGLVIVFPLSAADVPKPDFNRDVRPILSNHCFKCHGPATQKAGVRLDSLSHAGKKGAIIAGKPEKSAVIDRIIADDDDLRMPPVSTGVRLTANQIATLKAWIANGAEYAPHWSFVPPKRPTVPTVRTPNVGLKNPIDHFIAAELSKAGLAMSPPAEKSTLIRRVTLDLIGLLPTPAEVDAFVKDDSPDAFEQVVDRLLESPHYGERQARHWLDLARYADSNGYTIDGVRSMWPWRDWVIQAINNDMPFSQFTIEQLAGDLLPSPTKDQLIATGFHRNTSFNEEGGTDREQFRVERTVDRANTTGAVWLGLTTGCAQCHDHKFDPFSQKDYYRLYAFFNSCDEPQLTVGGRPDLEAKINDLVQMAEEFRKVERKAEQAKVEAEIKKLRGSLPSTLIVRELPASRPTHVQIRGDFLQKGDEVTTAFPTALVTKPVSPSAEKQKLTRLDLAKWLVSRENPLTARVTVNRYWQQFFGKGLVETENDFGMQGSAPTHPALLDWLAVEFMEKGWSVKAIHRLIVTSATYQQSSTARSELSAKDALNKLLGRQTRLRLEAEIIRDVALTASGLLSHKLGGPGVYPPQPQEIFALTQNRKPWPESQGEDRFRRGIYTVIYRQSQNHLLTTFDAADAQTTCTRRNRSNTPLQSLHLANDPVFVELAAGLGTRIEKEGPKADAGRVAFAFHICFGRSPTESEQDRVLKFYEAQKRADPKTAWAQVARVLMNLDEFITRE